MTDCAAEADFDSNSRNSAFTEFDEYYLKNWRKLNGSIIYESQLSELVTAKSMDKAIAIEIIAEILTFDSWAIGSTKLAN